MALFEFFLVGVSIVIGLGVTTVLEGVVAITRKWHGRRLHWIHIVWIVNSLLGLLLGWWNLWQLRDVPTWSFAQFLLVMVYVSTMFIFVSFIAPTDGGEEYLDGKAFYYGIKADFFRWGTVHMIAAYPYLLFLTRTTYPETPAWGVLAFGLVFASLMAIAWKTDRGWYHAGLALFQVASWVPLLLDPLGFSRLG